MSKVFLRIIHNRQGRGSSKKEVSVEFSFYSDGKRKYVSTGVKVRPNEWSKEKRAVVKRKDAKELNAIIEAYRIRAEAVMAKMATDGISDLDTLVLLLTNEEAKAHTFIEYCEKRKEERKVGASTKKRYEVFIKFLKSWGKIVTFSDCNVANVRSMDEFLSKEGKAQYTIYNYHKYLKLFINDAIVDGLLEKNPYNYLNFQISKGEKMYVDCISEEKFQKIKELKIVTPHIRKARDLFLFQCYTGLSYSDLMKFSYKDCEEIDGKLFYHSKRKKTDKDFVFQILTPAREILEKYNYELPTITNQKYNDYLKVVGEMVGEKSLHSHMGRATAATLFLSLGMQLNVVAKVLGHTNIRQTQRYARTLNKDVRSAFDSIEGKI